MSGKRRQAGSATVDAVGAALPKRTVEELQNTLGYTFRNSDYLLNALVHKSYLHAAPDFDPGSNERLEFLGDAVLGLIVSADLYLSRPGVTEGELSALRGALVRKDTLAELAEKASLGAYLYMSRGEEVAGGRNRASNLAHAMEAVLGALYLDGGLEAAEKVWHAILGEDDDEKWQGVLRADYKSRFQQLAQAENKITPSYRLAGTSGPEHAKEFHVEVLLGDRVVASGTGMSKQLAEQAAAEAALALISEQEAPEGGAEAQNK